jgi:osmotically inducible protein OsmC
MAPDLERSASAVWQGTLKEGNGKLSADSGTLKDTPYSWAMRFSDAPGTNPEELIAAAHAGCFTMQLSNLLTQKEAKIEQIETKAIVFMTSAPPRKITHIKLTTRAKVTGLDAAAFKALAEDAKQNCPVSVALSNVPMELDAELE